MKLSELILFVIFIILLLLNIQRVDIIIDDICNDRFSAYELNLTEEEIQECKNRYNS